MSHSQFHSIDLFILRHAWLNLWDKRMLLAESTRLLSRVSPLRITGIPVANDNWTKLRELDRGHWLDTPSVASDDKKRADLEHINVSQNKLSLATSASIPETKWVLMLFIGSSWKLPHRQRIGCECFIVVMLPLQPNGKREFSVRHDTWLLSWSVPRKQQRCQTSTPNLRSLIR